MNKRNNNKLIKRDFINICLLMNKKKQRKRNRNRIRSVSMQMMRKTITKKDTYRQMEGIDEGLTTAIE